MIIDGASLGERFSTYGTTFQCQTYNSTGLYTIAPQILQSVFSTNFDSWGVAPLRRFSLNPLTGHGIITADGSFWIHSRNLLKSTFSHAQISDLSAYRVHTDNLLTALLKNHHSFIDLKSYFENFTLDSSTELLFGHSIGSLTPNTTFNAWTFIQAYNIGQVGIGKRMRLPQCNFLTRDKRFWRSCSIIRGFVEQFVEQFVDYASASRKDPSYQASNRLVSVHQLSDETPNHKETVSQLLNVFLPVHDATAVALTNIF